MVDKFSVNKLGFDFVSVSGLLNHGRSEAKTQTRILLAMPIAIHVYIQRDQNGGTDKILLQQNAITIYLILSILLHFLHYLSHSIC